MIKNKLRTFEPYFSRKIENNRASAKCYWFLYKKRDLLFATLHAPNVSVSVFTDVRVFLLVHVFLSRYIVRDVCYYYLICIQFF